MEAAFFIYNIKMTLEKNIINLNKNNIFMFHNLSAIKICTYRQNKGFPSFKSNQKLNTSV